MELSSIRLGSLSLDAYPNSIQIIGEFKARVEHVEHPNLTKYVECFKNKNERITLVYEILPTLSQPEDFVDPILVAKQLLDALSYLHNTLNCVHGLITPESIVCSDQNLKLTNWPINTLSNGGLALGANTILSTNISFIAPEHVKSPKKPVTQQCDIWSACLSLLKLFKQSSCKLPENPCFLALCDDSEEVISQLNVDLDDKIDIIQEDIPRWKSFFTRALELDPSKRATLSELYSILELEQPVSTLSSFMKPLKPNEFEHRQEYISNLQISEIYYLWRLSIGRNLESEQKQDDCPPIFKIPYLIVSEKQSNPTPELHFKNHIIIDTTPKLIPLDVFKTDMSKLDPKVFCPLILTTNEDLMQMIDEDVVIDHPTGNSIKSSISLYDSTAIGVNKNSLKFNNNRKISTPEALTFADLTSLSSSNQSESANNQLIFDSSRNLPIVIKEADCAYQCERIILFKRLLSGCPYLKEQLKREAFVDIPPFYRAQIWTILLNVSPAMANQLYETIDKRTPVATDRQISVDIPRCHQYNELMASPQGHQKLARILKAWLNHNASEYVYWQGLDSLAAPFLLLNFHDEAVAFACFNAFVDKYLKGFFKKDNQLVVQEYLAMFSELLSYHDPALAGHLEELGFLPNLYAIPWFLTMFTHVLPLHKILHVWDCLLLGDEKFPLCIGLAILNQLRPELMEFSFNDCIVTFSNLPEIDIERCIKDASHFYNSTPDIKWK